MHGGSYLEWPRPYLTEFLAGGPEVWAAVRALPGRLAGAGSERNVPQPPSACPPGSDIIRFEDVSVSYGRERVLQDPSQRPVSEVAL